MSSIPDNPHQLAECRRLREVREHSRMLVQAFAEARLTALSIGVDITEGALIVLAKEAVQIQLEESCTWSDEDEGELDNAEA